MKILLLLLLPLVSLAADAGALIDLARGAPPEFAADSLIRIAGLSATPKAKKLELLREAFEFAGAAQHPYRLRSAVSRTGAAAAFLDRSYLQDLDTLTLRLRAIDALLQLDPKQARDLFEKLPPLQLPALGCAQNQGYDVSLYYEVMGSLATQSPLPGLDAYMAAVTSPAQVGPAARMLSHAGLGDSAFRTAIASFAAALRRVAADDRSFSLSSRAGADILALVEACRNRGVPPLLIIDAYRQYLVGHLAGERCADSPLPGSAANTDTGMVSQAVAETASSDAAEFFNQKVRALPVKNIEPYEIYPSKAEGKAAPVASCDDASCQAVRDGYRRLLFNPTGVPFTSEQRATPEWRDRMSALLNSLEAWDESKGGDAIASFAAKCGFYNDLAAAVVASPSDRNAIYRAMLDFLERSDLRSRDRAAWFLPLNALIARAAMDSAGSERLIEALAGSRDPVAALYARLELLAPRSPGRTTLLF